MDPQEVIDFARRFLTAVETGDIETVRGCYSSDAKIWHNNDGLEQTVEQNMKVLAWMARKLPARRYRVLRLEALSDGFLQQHVLEADFPNGAKWRLDACIVVRMAGGKIIRLDEYLDSGKIDSLMKAVTA